MIYHSNIILVTKPSVVNYSLNDGVAVWVTTSSMFLQWLDEAVVDERLV